MLAQGQGSIKNVRNKEAVEQGNNQKYKKENIAEMRTKVERTQK